MFEGYRGVVTSLAILAAIGFALWALIADLSTVDSAYRNSAAEVSIRYERDARANLVERCFSKAGLWEPDCAAQADEAARKGQREAQNLAAQNITAWWTKIMGVAALFGMVLSAVGVWLVKTTFDETKRSNTIAKDTLTSENRAWLQVDADIGKIRIDQWMSEAEMTITVKNVGKSVARNVVCWGSIHIVREGQIVRHDFSNLPDPQFMPAQRDRNIWAEKGVSLTRGCVGDGVRPQEMPTQTFRVFARAVAEYTTIFDNGRVIPRISEYVFEIHQANHAFLTQEFSKENYTNFYLVTKIEASSGGGRVT